MVSVPTGCLQRVTDYSVLMAVPWCTNLRSNTTALRSNAARWRDGFVSLFREKADKRGIVYSITTGTNFEHAQLLIGPPAGSHDTLGLICYA